jgi:hypothetical protein
MQKDPIPDAELRLRDGTHLMLYRSQGWTDHETKIKITGDRMVALEPGERRIVVFLYEESGKRAIRMVYDSHTREHGEHTDLPMPPDVQYWFYNIDDEQKRNRYLDWYAMFAAPAVEKRMES